MTPVTELYQFLFVGALLFGIGLTGFLTRRNMIVMFLSVEMMLQGVALNFVSFGWFHNHWGGQSFVIFIIAVAACEAAISLALVMMLYHRAGSLDITFWQGARELGLPKFVDREIPAFEDDDQVKYPTLTPAGIKPKPPEEQTEYEAEEQSPDQNPSKLEETHA